MRCSAISRSRRSGKFSRKPTQFVWERPLPVKPTRSTSRGNPSPSCPGNVDIDHAHPRIAQHIALEGFALDGNATNGTRRPEELAHASYPWLQRMLSRGITAGGSSTVSIDGSSPLSP